MSESREDRPQQIPELLCRLIERGARPIAGSAEALGVVRLMDDYVTVSKLAAHVRLCPPLVLILMRLASAPECAPYKADSIEGAIQVLGFMEVRRAALSLACMHWSLPRRHVAHVDPLLLRRRATVMACAAEDLAVACGREMTFDYYEAGMYSDIGFLFLASHMPKHLDRARVAAMQAGGPVLSFAEMAQYGCTHADISAMAGEMRGLPARLVSAVLNHHTPWVAGDSEPIADVLHAASIAADTARVMPVFGWPECAHDMLVYDRLGIDSEDATRMFAASLLRADSYLCSLPLRDSA